MDNGGRVPERVTLESLKERLLKSDGWGVELKFVLNSPFVSRHKLTCQQYKRYIRIWDYSGVDDSETETTWNRYMRSIYGKAIREGRCFFDD